MTEVELAWAAGLFEGEGCMSITKFKARANSIKVSVALSMTDKDVVEKFCSIIGVGRVKGPYQPQPTSRKVRYVWEIQNQSGCVDVIKLLLPYFGERRTKKANEFIEIIKQRKLTSE